MLLSNRYALLTTAIAICVWSVVGFASAMAQSARTPTPSPMSSPQTTVDTPAAISTPVQAPPLLFSTPPPVREEEPLAGGYRQIPSVFEYIDRYHPIEAEVSSTSLDSLPASTVRASIGSVVQILRCGDGFGCTTPVGTGVVVHPSGLILTAYHVLLEEPDDLTSRRYREFAIALTEGIRSAPRSQYLASLVAQKDELDIALLAIDRTLDGDVLDRDELDLPALPFANVDSHFGRELSVLGYPIQGS